MFDKDVLLSTIINRGSNFESLYTDPNYCYVMTGYWFKRWAPTFKRWLEVMAKEYEPLWNTDRFEEVHDDIKDVGTGSSTRKNTTDNDSTYTKSGTQKEVTDDDKTYATNRSETLDDDTVQTVRAPGVSGSNGTITENEVSAFDSSSYSPESKVTVTNNISQDTTNDEDRVTTGNESGSASDDIVKDTTETEVGTTKNDTEVNENTANSNTNDRDFDHSLHAWGNIGVMSSQQLFNEEWEVAKHNFYIAASDIFLKEMTIMVY